MKVINRSRVARTALALFVSVLVYAAFSPSVTTEAMESNEKHFLLVDNLDSGVPSIFRSSFDTAGEFRFITPIAPNPHDQSADFDADLLPYLTVTICKVTETGCTVQKTFTSTTSPDRLRIDNKLGSFFVANWTTGAGFDNTPTYRISVEVPGETLGSVDLPPSAYRQWGRTWPIKFIVEKDPELWVRMFATSGMTLWEIADELRTNFGVCDEELRDLLMSAFPDATDEQVAEVVNGVCQDVVLQPNTKIVDKETRDALALFDMSTGQMIFAGDTAMLRDFSVNDVIVSRHGPAAPYGYLRRITSIRKSKGIYTLETVQAKFTEAIQVGTLQVSGPLEPGSNANSSVQNSRQNKLSAPSIDSFGDTIDIGRQIPFTRHIDEEINLDGGDDEIGGTGTIRVIGDVEIRAGYNIGAGIELCTTPPFACADRVEAWMGFVQKSDLRVIGKFDGHLHKEFKYPIPMAPIFFMIGPLPVWLVPEVNVIVGLDGNAHVDFEFAAGAQSSVRPYIKWTEDEGWKDLSTWEPLSDTFLNATFAGDARLEGYAKLDAALLLYGAIGPKMDGSLGIVGEANTGERPFWKISGHVKSGIGLRSAFMDLFDINAHEDFLDEAFVIAEAPNIIPDCSPRTDVISANIGSPVYLGPTSGLGGYFTCSDPEGEAITYTAVSSSGADSINQQTLTATFGSSGPRTVTLTARDASGGVRGFNLQFNVFNAAPDLTVTTSGPSVPLGVQYFVSATAFDLETLSFLTCDRINWSVASYNTKEIDNIGACGGAIVFNREGTETITVVATDIHGAQTTKQVSVFVTPRPANLPPVIDNSSMTFYAHRGIGTTECIGIFNTMCFIPSDPTLNIYLWSGFGTRLPDEYVTPLYMNVLATDPEGDLVTYDWRCETGSEPAVVTDQGGGTFSCTPAYVPGVPVSVFAYVSDGINPPLRSNVRTFHYRIAPN